MRRPNQFGTTAQVEPLESRLAPSSIALQPRVMPSVVFQAYSMMTPMSAASATSTTNNDLGDDPPITQPPLPETGPLGPGSSV